MLEMLETLAVQIDGLLARVRQLEAEKERLQEELAAEHQLREAARQRLENILNKLRDVASQ